MAINVSKSAGSYIPKPSALKGAVLVFNGTDWVALNPPGDGYILTTDSSAAAGVAWKSSGSTGGTGGQSGLLKWAPPAQTTPTVDNVPAGGASFSYGDTEDAILVMPAATMTGTVEIIGGRNIRIIGGKANGADLGADTRIIDVADMGPSAGGHTAVESVFLEGLDIDLAAKSDLDMIWCGGWHDTTDPISSAKAATFNRPLLYIQNCRLGGSRWSGGGMHPDIVQKNRPLAGVRAYQSTFTSSYQGLFLPPQEGDKNGNWWQGGTPLNDLDRCNFIARSDRSAFPLWLNWDSNATSGQNTPEPMPHTTLGDVWIMSLKAGDTLGANLVYPRVQTGTSEAVNSNPGDVGMIVASNGLSCTWKSAARIDGTLKLGTPPEGDFCPAGVAGLSYSSPGYAT